MIRKKVTTKKKANDEQSRKIPLQDEYEKCIDNVI